MYMYIYIFIFIFIFIYSYVHMQNKIGGTYAVLFFWIRPNLGPVARVPVRTPGGL